MRNVLQCTRSVLIYSMMSGLRRMGLPIYPEVRGICPDYDKGGPTLRNVGWIRVSGRCPTLHQSRVQLDGISRSLPSGSRFVCGIYPQEIESRRWIFAWEIYWGVN